ncbi:uncharacterized protein AKAW2_50391S [Aspergillus luchuensis]|uniref:HMG box domain-containing protein n=1 Tax=Aspergillus kawachii TaxID=1069201 RepID=A0A7R7WC34_ASPKA|nr:uncharacterized protein AKAW2_50391S [Aspergillus luchuensis]BCS00050.1 hypothetical protein AKAW2_50391S [Aspergillus luchuensis]
MQHIPVRDMYAWVHRPVEMRRQEALERHGRISRPMKPFILYRLAYSDRAKRWFAQSDHQVISILTGRRWKLEAPHIREKYKTLAVMEKRNHARAHPGHRFSQSYKKKRSSQKPVLRSWRCFQWRPPNPVRVRSLALGLPRWIMTAPVNIQPDSSSRSGDHHQAQCIEFKWLQPAANCRLDLVAVEVLSPDSRFRA